MLQSPERTVFPTSKHTAVYVCKQKPYPLHGAFSKPVFPKHDPLIGKKSFPSGGLNPNHAHRHRISFTSPLSSFVCLRPALAITPHPMLKHLI